MSGMRSLTNEEIEKAYSTLKNTRDRCLFILGVKSGFRIQELLSIKISQVLQPDNNIAPRLKVERRIMKGKTFSRSVPIHIEAQKAILSLLKEAPSIDPNAYLFLSRQGLNRPITRAQAHNVLKEAFTKAGIFGSVATHSMRKTFASNVYSKLDYDLVATQKALGHASILSTIKYLQPDQEKVDAAILT